MIRNNRPKCAINIYAQMRDLNIEVDSCTIPSILKSCAQIGWVWIGKEIHGFTLKNGLGSDVFVGKALIPMYKECGSAVTARLLFDKMPGRDGVSWSTMIQVYCKRGIFDEALGVIQEMLGNSVKASEVSAISMANLLADIANVKLAKAMHAYVIKNSSMVHFSTYLTNSLIDLFAGSGNLTLARWLFDGLVERGIVSYTANIVGYIRCKALEEGVKLFRHMIARGIWPKEITLLSLITVCGAVEALDLANSYMLMFLEMGLPCFWLWQLLWYTCMIDVCRFHVPELFLTVWKEEMLCLGLLSSQLMQRETALMRPLISLF